MRHGQAANIERDSNATLTEIGIAQAEAFARFAQEEGLSFDTIYTSDMQRAQQTAEILSAIWEQSLIVESRLREYRGWDDRSKAFDLNDSGGYPLKRETRTEFRQRIDQMRLRCLEQHPSESVLWVGHGGIFDLLIGQSLGMGSNMVTMVHHTGLSLFDCLSDELPQLVFHNQLDHLSTELQTRT